ncbi:MAG: thiamine pyrophosphate-dependent dehydrogenase E1 component subunit alpha [Actinomycetota bacterium]
MPSDPSPSETAVLADAYRRMAAIRAFEEIVSAAHADGRLPGLLHLSIGGEAVAVGVIGRLASDDRVYSSHRAHGHFLAAGTDPVELMAELAGRENGICRGRGGSMHLMSERAVLATGVVGGTLPIAVGHAIALPAGAVSVVFFGDGAAQTGVFHEALNLAALWRARVLFVCENNGWAEFSAREEHTRVDAVIEYGHLHRMACETVDGSDIDAVRGATGRLLESVRAGAGPAMLECHVTRIRPHYEGDLRRTGEQANDPLARVEQRLVELGADAPGLARVREETRDRAAEALDQALGTPAAQPDDDRALVFARPVP